MFRQLTFGLAVAACLAFATSNLQAQCVGCGGSTPIYSQPISSGAVYNAPMYNQGYSAPMYNSMPSQVVYNQPVMQNYAMPQTFTSGCNSCGTTGVVSSGCNTCGMSGMVSTGCNGCGMSGVVTTGCNTCGTSGVVTTGYSQPVMNYAPMQTSVPMMSNGCGCSGNVIMGGNMGGVIMDGNMNGMIMNNTIMGGSGEVIVEPQATGEVVDPTSPPAPVEAKPEESKSPAPATETSAPAKK